MPRGRRGEQDALAIETQGARIALKGALGARTIPDLDRALSREGREAARRTFDLANLSALDTSGALFLSKLRAAGASLTGLNKDQRALVDLVGELDLTPLPKPASPPHWRQLLVHSGRAADAACRDTYDILAFVGRGVDAVARALASWRRLRPASISRHIEETGIRALPIIGLMAVMIAVVIGYQSVAQLRPYGGEDFTVNLVAVSVLREMGVLITAIMVAGRSGSAFTAEIGVMRAREEIDALEVMGVDPMEVLVAPRLIALLIKLPLLTFFADVGLVKAPVFAFSIGVIGCMHGLRVRGTAESVGTETTRAVVKGIFLVIVLGALFSVLFEKLGI